MKKLIFTLSMVVLACSCQPRNDQNDQNNRQAPPPQRRGGCCETEKPAAPSQQATAANPEVKVEKAQ